MARPLRIQFPCVWYPVTSRGNERRDIFSDDADRSRLLDILAESASIYGAEIHLKEEVRAQSVLGSEESLEWLRDRLLSGAERQFAELPAARALGIQFRSPGAIAARLAPIVKVTVDHLLRLRSRYRDERAIFLELCRRHLSVRRSMSSSAADLGIGVSAPSQNRNRLGARMDTDQHLRKRFEQAKNALTNSES